MMPSDFDWYFKVYAWAARIGVATTITIPIAIAWWALS